MVAWSEANDDTTLLTLRAVLAEMVESAGDFVSWLLGERFAKRL